MKKSKKNEQNKQYYIPMDAVVGISKDFNIRNLLVKMKIFVETMESGRSLGESKRKIFLSYCQLDADIANLVEEKIGPHIKHSFSISRDVRDVLYRESFKKFMKSIREHDFVIMIISDRYMKSINCMYEVMEILKDNNYKSKIIFIVLSESDKKYFNHNVQGSISADIYNSKGQGRYIIYWNDYKKALLNIIKRIENPMQAIAQIEEVKRTEKIIFELPEFLGYIVDAKGLPLEEHLDSEFLEIRKILSIKEE